MKSNSIDGTKTSSRELYACSSYFNENNQRRKGIHRIPTNSTCLVNKISLYCPHNTIREISENVIGTTLPLFRTLFWFNYLFVTRLRDSKLFSTLTRLFLTCYSPWRLPLQCHNKTISDLLLALETNSSVP